MGKKARPFFVLKFRTMVQDAFLRGGPITFGDDPRITTLGKWLRKTKVDELPQLLNILRGDMSFVGPRPEVRKYVDMFHQDFEQILQIRPGLTDLASLRYRDEAELLGRSKTRKKPTSSVSCRTKSVWLRSTFGSPQWLLT